MPAKKLIICQKYPLPIPTPILASIQESKLNFILVY